MADEVISGVLAFHWSMVALFLKPFWSQFNSTVIAPRPTSRRRYHNRSWVIVVSDLRASLWSKRSVGGNFVLINAVTWNRGGIACRRRYDYRRRPIVERRRSRHCQKLRLLRMLPLLKFHGKAPSD
ncbi:hypothetical protein KCP69_13215 [Salmonella enterica subsp. enterica]|nr:hypothetical protein KCP69_13215 [Salmonella enterica subsp. enterica]